MDKNMEEKMFQMDAEVCKSMANPTRLKIMTRILRVKRAKSAFVQAGIECLDKRLFHP